MPVPPGRDMELTRERLAAWCGRMLPDASGIELSDLSAPGSTGFSNDTLLFDLSWTRKDGRAHCESLVARIQPTGFRVFPDYDLDLQFRVQSILADTPVPVARMFWQESDPSVLGAPFYVMERVEGQIPTDNPPYHVGGWVTEIRPQDRQAIWWSGLDVMSEIHRLDWKALGFGFLDQPEKGATPLAQELANYAAYLEWARRGRSAPICQPALEWLQGNQPSEEEPVRLCWGDARIGNMIFREFRCVAVLDWEMVTLGNPVKDLAWYLFLDHHHSAGIDAPRLEGFPGREATLARWEDRTGLSTRHVAYYETYAAFRFSVIMMRLAQSMQHYGFMAEDSSFEIDNIPSRLLAKRLDLQTPAEAAKSWP
jgi:aminoglycoside phosphotransferase (APT) family kinase protein